MKTAICSILLALALSTPARADYYECRRVRTTPTYEYYYVPSTYYRYETVTATYRYRYYEPVDYYDSYTYRPYYRPYYTIRR